MVRRGDELVVVRGEGATLMVLEDPSQPLIDGRRLEVRGERESFRVGPGTALLMANGRAVALCP
jgi:hypothetical protein